MRQNIVAAQGLQADPHCYRFAPLKDRFMFSVIYKNCTCAEEPRGFFAAVNWLMTAEEADAFFGSKFAVRFFECVVESDKILKSNGYNIELHTAPIINKEIPTVNKKKALISAAYYATTAVTSGGLRAQVFVGCDRENGLFDTLFWVIGTCPLKLRKYLSFHVGFSAVSETFGVALAIAYSDVLGVISSTGKYSGAMTVKKIIFLNDNFISLSPLPEVATSYITVSEDDKARADKFFVHSEDASHYWSFLSLFSGDAPSGADMALCLGEENFISGINGGLFTEEELVDAYKNRDRLYEMPRAIELLRECVKCEEEEDVSLEGGFVIVADEEDKKRGRKKAKKEKKKKKEYKEDDEREEERDDEREEERDEHDERNEREDTEKGKKYGKKKEKKKDKHSYEKKPSRFNNFRHTVATVTVKALKAALVPVGCILFLVGIGFGMFHLGVDHIPHLSKDLALLCYALQIASLVFLCVPFGYILISSLKREKVKNDEPNEEESD